MPVFFGNLGGNCVNLAIGFPFSSINMPKKLVTVSLSRVIPSMNNSGNFVGMGRFLEGE